METQISAQLSARMPHYDRVTTKTPDWSQWSSHAQVVYLRTYSRNDNGRELWPDTVERAIMGNVRGHNVESKEIERLRYYFLNRKATSAGRGLWYSGTASHEKLGGAALSNCWFLTADDWENFAVSMDLLMLGGGVGLSVENLYVQKLPKIKKDVSVQHNSSKDAYFIVPDNREGWCALIRKVLKSYFVSGKSFDYSTCCIRGAGEPIHGFGGTASGPIPLIRCVENLCNILDARAGKSLRPIDAADLICAIGEMVKAGNVRRSAIIILGDSWDKTLLRCKRWDLGIYPSYRASANFTVVAEEVDDLHPEFWKTYEIGEPFGIFNRTNARKYGRMGELKPDKCVGVNPCSEATLESGESCVRGDTKLITESGISEIRELVGKAVKIWNGEKWASTTPFIASKRSEFFRVRFSDGSYLDATPGHRWLVKHRFQKSYQEVTTEQLITLHKSKKYPLSVPRSGIAYEGGKDMSRVAYEYGVFAGDGFMDRGVPKVELYGKKMTLPIVTTAKGKEKIHDEHNIPCIRVVLGQLDVGMCADLRNPDLGLSPGMFGWDRKSILKFIAGWADTDGSAQGCGIRIYGTEKKIRDGQLLLTKCGVDSSVNQMSKRGDVTNYGIRSRDVWYLQIPFSFEIPSCRVGGRKRARNMTKGKYQVIDSIDKLAVTGPSYCLTEPETHRCVFGNVLTLQCNLQEIAMHRLNDIDEFAEAGKLMHRWGKRVTMERYHHAVSAEVIARNRRIGTGITGCLRSELFEPNALDHVYREIQKENVRYSKELGIPESIRTTVVKPSGTMGKVMDSTGYEGIHAAYSKHFIQRVRFGSSDPLIPHLKRAGHPMEMEVNSEGKTNHDTVVVDFYCRAPDGFPVADQNFDTWKQLDVLKMAQRHWADQAVSVTIYYRKEEIAQIKDWLRKNLSEIKAVSFLCHSDHGFKQAPKEAITEEQYDRLTSRIKPLDVDASTLGDGEIDGTECAGGVCPVK